MSHDPRSESELRAEQGTRSGWGPDVAAGPDGDHGVMASFLLHHRPPSATTTLPIHTVEPVIGPTSSDEPGPVDDATGGVRSESREPPGAPESRARGPAGVVPVETSVFRAGVAVLTLHLLTDAFVLVRPGVSPADHLASGVVPVMLSARWPGCSRG